MKQIGIGLLGFGTVGAGVVEGLRKNGALIGARLGLELRLSKIADIDLDRDRGVAVDRSLLTKDAEAAINDPAVDVVVELIGGTGVARRLIEKALALGKPVVTANKALLAEHGEEIFALAAQHNTDMYFEASVGGGIPIIRALREGLVANHIDSIYGILNGTCNYILTRMEQEHLAFGKVLKEAQKLGYAEADPGLDIDGHDTAHKAEILASLAYGFHVPLADVHVEGIRDLAEADIAYARDLGYRIKLLAVMKSLDDAIEVRVHPTLIPVNHMLASVGGVFNAIMVEGDIVGQTLYYGRGAGRQPTASAVISDLADAARNLAFHSPRRMPALVKNSHEKIREIGDIEARYYIRLSLLDKPGVLGQIASVLGQNHISIASVLQKEGRAGDYVPVVIVTHFAKERDFRTALKEMAAMHILSAKPVRFRIEDMLNQPPAGPGRAPDAEAVAS
jgi:homoserine dehydrogenase